MAIGEKAKNATADAVMAALIAGGYLLARGRAEETDEANEEGENPEEFDEDLREYFRLVYEARIKANSLIGAITALAVKKELDYTAAYVESALERLNGRKERIAGIDALNCIYTDLMDGGQLFALSLLRALKAIHEEEE